MRSLSHFVREALSGFRRNFSTVLGAIVTIYLSLLVIGIFLVATMIIDQLISQVENQVEITMYVRDDALEEDIWEIQGFILTLPGVSDTYFVSKDEALARFTETASPDIVESLYGNPLPASIEISMSDPEQVENVANQIIATDLCSRVIEDPDNPYNSIKYGREIVNRLFSLTRIIRVVCISLVALLIFVALIFIINTIRLTIFARRREISIMRLVGASKSFIRGPYLTEGAMQALLGSGMAVLTIHFGLDSLAKNMQLNIQWLTINFSMIPLQTIYLSLLGVGLAIGLIGSALAMRRYLKV
ncbi:MAG: permease-like cell division protein FtsX [Coriobacteriia bacterium]|nr:permease-like cell division protein FtsX [Coriobacteriia bacterium]